MAPAILLTRPAQDAAPFAARLRAQLGPVRIVVSPLLRIVPAGGLPDLTGIAGVIFTSRNGVRAWVALNGPQLPCYCVGPGTGEEARAAGMAVRAGTGDGAALARQIARDRPGGAWLHLHGAHLSVDLTARLRPAGIDLRGHVLYRQEGRALDPAARSLLRRREPVVVPVFSPRTGKLLVQGEMPVAPLYMVPISAAVAKVLAPWPRQGCVVAERPDAEAMLAATVRAHATAARVEGPGGAQ